MLKSKFMVFVPGGILGIAVGAGGTLIAFPFLFPPPVANDAAPKPVDAAAPAMIAFRLDETAPGRDPVHWADGSGVLKKP